jgi:hypothetical protein
LYRFVDARALLLLARRVSDHGLIGVRVERYRDQESPFSGRLIGFRGEEPDALVSILVSLK